MRGSSMIAMVTAAALGASTAALASGTDRSLPGPIPAAVVRVVDGDTLTVRARIWIGQEVETNVRLAGVDAPELHARCDDERERALRARDFTERLTQGGEVTLSEVRTDKFGGRVDARVRTPDGVDVSDALIKAGLARAYAGDRRAAWCAE